jgi:hypothetical protein
MYPNRSITKDIWIARFTARLTELLPSMNCEAALDIAYSEFLISSNETPEISADDYASLRLPAGCNRGLRKSDVVQPTEVWAMDNAPTRIEWMERFETRLIHVDRRRNLRGRGSSPRHRYRCVK